MIWTEKDEKQNALDVLIRRFEGLQYGNSMFCFQATYLCEPSLIYFIR